MTNNQTNKSQLIQAYRGLNNAELDRIILDQLSADAPSSMDMLFDRYYQYLCGLSYQITRDQDIAEDIVQDIFIWIWQNRATLSISCSLRAYLKRSVLNHSINYSKRKKTTDLDFLDSEEMDDSLNGLETLEYQELSKRVYDAIGQLPAQCRLVFEKSRFESKTYQEIADELELSIKTVGNHISKALKLLRRKLHSYQLQTELQRL